MSKVSAFLHAAIGIQEINLSHIPVASKLIGTLTLSGARWLVRQLPNEDLINLSQAVAEETIIRQREKRL